MEEVKSPLFKDDMILYVENAKKSTKTTTKPTLPELMNEFREIGGYKIK